MALFYFDNGEFIQKGGGGRECEKAGGTLSLMKQLDGSHALIVSEKLGVL